MEEMSAAGFTMLVMVVAPAINGTIISKFGTDEQKKRWLPGIADGSITMAFAITEPHARSDSHRITPTARRGVPRRGAPAPPPPPRRERLGSQRREGVHLRRRPGAGRARRRPHGGSQDRQPASRVVHRAHRYTRSQLDEDRDRTRQTRDTTPSLAMR